MVLRGLITAKNYGVAYSIIRGFCYAAEHYIKKVIIMDADGQHNPAYIPQFLEELEEHEFVFGCRFYKMKSRSQRINGHRIYLHRLYMLS